MANGSIQDLISSVRRDLRINHMHLDGEILDLIEAAKADLRLSGILAGRVGDVSDPLIKRAICCYVKAEFGLDNKDSEKYRKSYESLKLHLLLSNEYTKEA